jgi:phage terminase small subunit
MAKTATNSQSPVVKIVTDRLTDKHRVFCAEFVKDFHGTKAAIRAGYTVTNAAQTACRLLMNANICEEIARLMESRLKKAETDALYILKRLKDELEADVNDLYDEESGCLKAVHEMPLVWRQGLIAGIETQELFETQGRGAEKVRVKIGEIKKIKLSDRAKRIELLGRHVDVNAWKQDESGKDVASALEEFMQKVSGNVLGPVLTPRTPTLQ